MVKNSLTPSQCLPCSLVGVRLGDNDGWNEQGLPQQTCEETHPYLGSEEKKRKRRRETRKREKRRKTTNGSKITAMRSHNYDNPLYPLTSHVSVEVHVAVSIYRMCFLS